MTANKSRKRLPSPWCSSWQVTLILLILWFGLVRQWRQPAFATIQTRLKTDTEVVPAVISRPFASADGGTRTPPQQKSPQHVVFIGDSALLYSYLEFVDRVHYHRADSESAPPALIHVGRHAGWEQFFQYTVAHFQGSMSCDCYHAHAHTRPHRGVAPSRSYENRFYSNGTVTASYLRGYYDIDDDDGHVVDPRYYVTRGRYRPHELPRAQTLLNANGAARTDAVSVAPAAINNSDPAAIWQYQGLDWDQLILNYVSQLLPKPTAIVLHAGMRPNDDIGINMARILRAAQLVVGDNGIVIWRKSLPRHNETSSPNAPSSPADEAARDSSYNIPGIVYQPFPSPSTTRVHLTPMDYYDHYHFSQPSLYQLWNKDLNRALWNRPPVQRVAVIVAGAIRTLPRTHQTMMQNLVRQLCPPYSCISHLILHISGTDNRPDRNSVDPRGVMDGSPDVAIRPTYFQHPSDYNWPDDYLQFHWVDEPYQIGTSEEQAAMDKYEEEFRQHLEPFPDDSPKNETKPEEIIRRFSVIRFGDPRRYSMWFARAWAWRYTKKLNISFDFHIFVRPDLLWSLPVPTMTFFREYNQSDREVWVHDRYFENVPDTFAFLPTRTAAENYLSLRHLLHPKAACLGGPDFNKSLVQARLHSMNITAETRDWCRDFRWGFSERILQRKLDQARLPHRWLATGVSIWRLPAHVFRSEPFAHGMLMCEPLQESFISPYWKYPSSLPFWACELAQYALQENWTSSSVPPSSLLAPANPDIIPLHFFRWLRRDSEEKLCLTRIGNYSITFVSEPCQDPVPVEQIYAEDPTHAHIWLGFDFEHNVLNIPVREMDRTVWFREPVELYSSKNLIEL